MTLVTVAAVIVANYADWATWRLLPPGSEANPLIRDWHSEQAWAAKALLAVVVLCLAYALPRLPNDWSWTPTVARVASEVLVVAAIAAGFVGVGSNLAVLV